MAMRTAAAAAAGKKVDASSGSESSESLSSPSFEGGFIPVPRAPVHDPPLTDYVKTFIAHEKERCATAISLYLALLPLCITCYQLHTAT